MWYVLYEFLLILYMIGLLYASIYIALYG